MSMEIKIKTDYVNGKLMAVAGCRLIQSFNQPNKIHATSKLDFISRLSTNKQIKKRSRILHSGVRSALVSKVAIALRSPESSSVKSGYCTPERKYEVLSFSDEWEITTDRYIRWNLELY